MAAGKLMFCVDFSLSFCSIIQPAFVTYVGHFVFLVIAIFMSLFAKLLLKDKEFELQDTKTIYYEYSVRFDDFCELFVRELEHYNVTMVPLNYKFAKFDFKVWHL